MHTFNFNTLGWKQKLVLRGEAAERGFGSPALASLCSFMYLLSLAEEPGLGIPLFGFICLLNRGVSRLFLILKLYLKANKIQNHFNPLFAVSLCP